MLLCLLSVGTSLYAQDEEDDEYLHGLNARYTASTGNIERVDDDIAFDWGSNAPDSRISANFAAEWTGRLLVREATNYRFHAHAAGEVEVEIDGRSILAGKSEQPGWIAGAPTPISFGEKKIRVHYRKTGSTARLSLYWSSDVFPLEPVPAHLLFRDKGDGKAAVIERGRILFDAHRCNRCHRRENDLPSMPAPDLTTIAGNVDPVWLIKQIENPGNATPHAKMPHLGLSTDDARAAAAFLWAKSAPAKLDALPSAQKPEEGPLPTADEERRQGEVLFRSVGCLACHRLGEFGNDGTYSGGDLADIGQKRSREWLFTWLGDPGRLNGDHRMPTIKLSPNERRLLAVYLSSLQPRDAQSAESNLMSAATDAQVVARGGKVIESARCAACHRIPGIAPAVDRISDLSDGISTVEKSCLADAPATARHRPAYRQIDRDAIVAFLNSRKGTLTIESSFARGAHLLQRRNCIDCHERGLGKGIVDTAGLLAREDSLLRGQSEALIPPALTAVGDKLLVAALAEAVSGDQKTVRLPWLRVRMPRFEHSPADKADLMAYLIGHDRIPDGAPDVAITKSSQAAGSQTLFDGHSLVGPKGFVCISCHEMGSFKPRNVALGTHGSDLLMLGKRMRKPFYLRWTRAPLRIVPGMEMPSYARALPDILGGDIDAQLGATWDALNDPRFVPPTDLSAVEQFVTVGPGAAPQIVRDVFTSQDGKAGDVSRAFAVGFDNGHNLLFDLDRVALRQWTFGDFARERTAGKSWYWDMAGVAVFVNSANGSDIVLRGRGSTGSELLSPRTENGTRTRLVSYRTSAKGEPASVELQYRVFFDGNGNPLELNVQETYQPIYPDQDAKTVAGWERRIAVTSAAGILSDFDVLFVRPKLDKTQLGAAIDVAIDGKAIEESSDSEYLVLGEQAATKTIVLRYACSLVRSALTSPPGIVSVPRIEQVTSTPGYDGVRLPLDRKIMPTAIAWTSDGRLAFTSLEGHVYTARDTDSDSIEDQLTVFEEGLAAPYGIIADGDDLIVCHKPEVLRLRDTNHDGRADVREVVASGWGYSSNYHDWTTSIVRDSDRSFFVGLGSDYNQETRPKELSLWRGKVVKIDKHGAITPIGHAFRYPTGLAIDREGRIFVSDNQGVQNTFNEINHLVAGKHYGVPSRWEEDATAPTMPPAIQVPHPWTRSVNGLFFLNGETSAPFDGHGIGCEYDSRFLVRFTTEEVEGVVQGAVYAFSRPNSGTGSDNFLGPLCGAVAPNGDIYIGSINDSGWQGGRNTGDIVRLRRNGTLPNGIKELRATPDGFEIEFFQPVDPSAASKPVNYGVSGYTRVWKGGYATPDSDRHRATIQSVEVAADTRSVKLHLDGLREGHVYEVHCGDLSKGPAGKLWPDTGHYSLHRRPRAAKAR